MKNTKLRLFPPMLMLAAGSIASIMTYCFQYELKTALLILLSVLLIFYIIGLIFIKVIMRFDRINEEKRLAEEQEAMENMEETEENLDLEGTEGEYPQRDTDEYSEMSQDDLGA